ncbi:hypothetical protein ACIODS_12285 [Micromonospora chalcea]|uniref:hypothetical protein n=1 Tax=Micromonospora chalcea TaxID=1874 RepID=UPI0037FB13E7
MTFEQTPPHTTGLTGQWYVADTNTPAPAMTVSEHRFVDPWPDTWTPVGPATARLEYDYATGHSLIFTDPTQTLPALPDRGTFALGCDDQHGRARLICPAATRDYLGPGRVHLIGDAGQPLTLYTAGTVRPEGPGSDVTLPVIGRNFAAVCEEHGMREGVHFHVNPEMP